MTHSQSSKIVAACERCGKALAYARWETRRKKRKYCSRACYRMPRALLPHPTDPDALIVPLTMGMEAVIDAADRNLVAPFSWAAKKDQGRWYARRNHPPRGKQVLLHRWLIGAPPEAIIDHADRDGLNCRRSNIRLASPSQNAHNSEQRRGVSGYRGVTKAQCKGKARWKARIRVDGKVIYLGTFADKEEAARAYDAKARAFFAEFARTNFPDNQ